MAPGNIGTITTADSDVTSGAGRDTEGVVVCSAVGVVLFLMLLLLLLVFVIIVERCLLSLDLEGGKDFADGPGGSWNSCREMMARVLNRRRWGHTER